LIPGRSQGSTFSMLSRLRTGQPENRGLICGGRPIRHRIQRVSGANVTIHLHSPIRFHIHWICSWAGLTGGVDTVETRGNFACVRSRPFISHYTDSCPSSRDSGDVIVFRNFECLT
jgi:hypothetical protein